MKNRTQRTHSELRPEYNFDYSKAIRGKYHQRLSKEGVNVVVLEPDIAEAFRDSATVNDVLRSLLELTRSTRRLTKRSSRRTTKTKAHYST
jgi:arginine deiminase